MFIENGIVVAAGLLRLWVTPKQSYCVGHTQKVASEKATARLLRHGALRSFDPARCSHILSSHGATL